MTSKDSSNQGKPEEKSGNGKVFCTHCGRAFVPICCKKIEDFRVVGEYWGCPVCHHPLDMPKPSSKDNSAFPKTNGFGQLFGDTSSQMRKPSKSIFSTDVSDVHLCKDCRYYLVHPFDSRCTRFDRPVEPTDDCPDFVEKCSKKTLDI